MKVPPAPSGGESRTKERNVMDLQPLNLDKEEILRAIDTLAQSGIKISVEQIHGREDLLAQLVELTTEFRAATDHLKRLNGNVARHEDEVTMLKLRAAARDAGCPLIEVLRVEVQGIQAAILRDLQAARDMVVERKAEMDIVERWENRFMPFIRPEVIALISALLTLIVIHGQEILKGWAGKGQIGRARAWIFSGGRFAAS